MSSEAKEKRPLSDVVERMWAQALVAVSSVEEEAAQLVQRLQAAAGWSQEEMRRQAAEVSERLRSQRLASKRDWRKASGGLFPGFASHEGSKFRHFRTGWTRLQLGWTAWPEAPKLTDSPSLRLVALDIRRPCVASSFNSTPCPRTARCCRWLRDFSCSVPPAWRAWCERRPSSPKVEVAVSESGAGRGPHRLRAGQAGPGARVDAADPGGPRHRRGGPPRRV